MQSNKIQKEATVTGKWPNYAETRFFPWQKKIHSITHQDTEGSRHPVIAAEGGEQRDGNYFNHFPRGSNNVTYNCREEQKCQ